MRLRLFLRRPLRRWTASCGGVASICWARLCWRLIAVLCHNQVASLRVVICRVVGHWLSFERRVCGIRVGLLVRRRAGLCLRHVSRCGCRLLRILGGLGCCWGVRGWGRLALFRLL